MRKSWSIGLDSGGEKKDYMNFQFFLKKFFPQKMQKKAYYLLICKYISFRKTRKVPAVAAVLVIKNPCEFLANLIWKDVSAGKIRADWVNPELHWE